VAKRTATPAQRASTDARTQRAELRILPLLIERIFLLLGGIGLTAGLIAKLPVLALLCIPLFGVAIIAHFLKLAKLGQGNWYAVESIFGRMTRPRYGEDGKWVIIPPWLKLMPDPIWVDQALRLDMLTIKDLITGDDLPFALKGNVLLRFYPDKADREFLRMLLNETRIAEVLLDYIRIEIARFVNQVLLDTAENFETSGALERHLRSPDFKRSLQQMIQALFTPLSTLTPQVRSAQRFAGHIFGQYGVSLAAMYVSGGYSDSINKTRQNIAGATQGARMARQVQETEDISLEEITLAASATSGYIKLRGYVPMNGRTQQNRQRKQAAVPPAPTQEVRTPAQTEQHVETPPVPTQQAAPPPVQEITSPPQHAAPPPVQRVTPPAPQNEHAAPHPADSEPEEATYDIADRIARLSSPISVVDILKERSVQRNQKT